MERKVPSTASDEIALYLQTIYSLLRSTSEVQVRTLEEVHAGMNSTLHLLAREDAPDVGALIYSSLRLPDCMPFVQTVTLGQNQAIFIQHGYGNVEQWQRADARARRRCCFFDGKGTLACYIASRSDIEDVVPALTAFQIEWNKLNSLLQRCPDNWFEKAAKRHPQQFVELAKQLLLNPDDLERLLVIWGEKFSEMLRLIKSKRCNLRIRLLSGSLSDYWRATRAWWENIARNVPDLDKRPVYFVSSNPHSIANLITGFVNQNRDELIKFIEQGEQPDLSEEWQKIKASEVPSDPGNFLYYALKKYQQTPAGSRLVEEQYIRELQAGLVRVPSEHSFDIEAQVIELSKMDASGFDQRLKHDGWQFLKKSDAVILNIDYPLGVAAYHILFKVAEHAGSIPGVYIMGKAASLNGKRGDVLIPTVVYDEHSKNTYMFRNAFGAEDIIPYLKYGSILDNQKAVTVLGTFLQNSRVMDVIYREGYTDIEMEAGPYLSAIYEMFRPKRHPVDEIVSLHRLPFDLGILHYASDTPLSKGKNLGAGTLSYFGMDSTYATSIAILRRIFELEKKRIEQ
jgi:hypothetical protein